MDLAPQRMATRVDRRRFPLSFPLAARSCVRAIPGRDLVAGAVLCARSWYLGRTGTSQLRRCLTSECTCTEPRTGCTVHPVCTGTAHTSTHERLTIHHSHSRKGAESRHD